MMENNNSETPRYRIPQWRRNASQAPNWIKAARFRPFTFLEPAGYWFVSCDTEIQDSEDTSEFDRVWEAAQQLVDEGIFIQAKYCTYNYEKAKNGLLDYTTVAIYCFVENYLDIDNVVKTAEELRKKVHYPYPLYLSSDIMQDGRRVHVTRYMYCLDSDLYEYSSGYAAIKLRRGNT